MRTATIDASSQVDENDNPLVEIMSDGNGTVFETVADSCVISSLTINRVFQAIHLLSNNNIVEGNYIGTDTSGRSVFHNDSGDLLTNKAVVIEGGSSNFVGELPASARPRVRKHRQHLGGCMSTAGNANKASKLEGPPPATNNAYVGNLIGVSDVGPDGEPPVPVGNGTGISFTDSASGNFVGGTAPGAGNAMAFNAFAVDLTMNDEDNDAFGNSVYCNTMLGISSSEAAPVLSNSRAVNGDELFDLTLSGGRPSAQYLFDFYVNADSCDRSQGEVYIGTASGNLTTDSTGGIELTLGIRGGLPHDDTLTAVAKSAGHNISGFSNAIPGAGGGQLPGTPTGLVATATGPTMVHLTWTNAATTSVLFHVERKTDGTAFAEIGTASTTSFDDLAANPNTRYTYRVRAQSTSNGLYTDYSSEAVAQTPPLIPAVTGLFPSKVKKKKAILVWSYDASVTIDRFDVLAFDGTQFVLLGSVSSTSRSVLITSLRRRTFYRIAVRACEGTACSVLTETSFTTR
jgi:titin